MSKLPINFEFYLTNGTFFEKKLLSEQQYYICDELQKREKKPERSTTLHVLQRKKKIMVANGKLKCARVVQQLNHQTTYTTQNIKGP